MSFSPTIEDRKQLENGSTLITLCYQEAKGTILGFTAIKKFHLKSKISHVFHYLQIFSQTEIHYETLESFHFFFCKAKVLFNHISET